MDTKDVKQIKIVGADTQRVMANNEVWWSDSLKPDYEFYDSEIGKNSNWSKRSDGYYYLNKFKGEIVVFIRKYDLYKINKMYTDVAGMILETFHLSQYVNGFLIFCYSDSYRTKTCENYLFKEGRDNTYKTYVFKCPNKYEEEFAQKLEDFANSL